MFNTAKTNIIGNQVNKFSSRSKFHGRGGEGLVKPLIQGAMDIGKKITNLLGPVRPTGANTTNQNPSILGSNSNFANSAPTPEDFKKLGTITTPYGGNTKFEKFHPGIDIANKEGTPIPSFSGGTVTGEGVSPSFGNYVKIKDDRGYTLTYSHLKQDFVSVGQRVNRGQVFGLMGRTGNVYSRHGGDPSHLDLRIVDAFNQYVNPNQYLSTGI